MPIPTLRTAFYQVYTFWAGGTPETLTPYDEVTDYVCADPGVVAEWGRDQARAFSPPAIPQISFDLRNDDRTFSPGGPLGTFVGRGPLIQAYAFWGDDVVLVDDPDVLVDDLTALVRGRASVQWQQGGGVDTVEHQLEWGHRRASIRGLGTMTTLRDASSLTTPLYENITVSDAVTHILDLVSWPIFKRAISTSTVQLRYWWLSNTNALDALNQLLRTEGAGAAIYEDGGGTFHFEDRTFRTTAIRALTPQHILVDEQGGANISVDDTTTLVDSSAVFVDSGTAGALSYAGGMQISANPNEVVNDPTVTVVWRSEDALAPIWKAGTAFVLAAGETRDFYIAPSDPFKSAVDPVGGGTDYTLASGSLVSATLSETSGQVARLRLVAGGSGAAVQGPTGSTADGIQVRAIPITKRYETTLHTTLDTSASKTRYTGGQAKSLDLAPWPVISMTTAQALVDNFAAHYQTPREQIQFTLENASQAHMTAIMTIQVSDRLTIRNAQAVETVDVHVEQIQHAITTGNLHRLTLGCEVWGATSSVPEPGGTSQPAQFGTVAPYAQFGTTHVFTS